MSSRTTDSVKACFDDILQRTGARSAIISFSSIHQVAGDAIPLFTQLQRSLRNQSVQIRICGMRPDQKERLQRAGVIRGEELRNSVRDAVASLSSRRVAA